MRNLFRKHLDIARVRINEIYLRSGKVSKHMQKDSTLKDADFVTSFFPEVKALEDDVRGIRVRRGNRKQKEKISDQWW